jgi:hypothetical protein
MNQDPVNFKLFNDGVVFTFDNGYSVSIRWGVHNYADRVNTSPSSPFSALVSAFTAEVAVIGPQQIGCDFYHVEGFDYNGDDVLPNVTAEQVVKILSIISAKKV